MVSQTLPRDADTHSSASMRLRPMDPTRDLSAIARVIEVAFADELSPGGHVIMRDLRLMNTLRPLLWVLGQAMPSLRDFFSGYVVEVDGRVVANTTVTRADQVGHHWIISNVAVLPEYRRQGLARAMMEAAIDHVRVRAGGRIALQVRSENEGARRLYETLGFRFLEAVTELVGERVSPTSFIVDPDVQVSKPVPSRWHEAYDVARAAVPLAVQQVRPLRTTSYRVAERSLLERPYEYIFGPSRERWWVEVSGQVSALLTIDRRLNHQAEQVELMISPSVVGRVEAALVNQLTSRMEGHRSVRVNVAASLTEARILLQAARFQELRTLDQMVMEL